MKIEKVKMYSFKSRMESDNSLARTSVGITEDGNVLIRRDCLNLNDLTVENWNLIRKTKFGNYYTQSYCFKPDSFKNIFHILHEKFDFFRIKSND